MMKLTRHLSVSITLSLLATFAFSSSEAIASDTDHLQETANQLRRISIPFLDDANQVEARTEKYIFTVTGLRNQRKAVQVQDQLLDQWEKCTDERKGALYNYSYSGLTPTKRSWVTDSPPVEKTVNGHYIKRFFFYFRIC